MYASCHDKAPAVLSPPPPKNCPHIDQIRDWEKQGINSNPDCTIHNKSLQKNVKASDDNNRNFCYQKPKVQSRQH